MSWTKRQFVNKALSKIGYAAYAYDTDAEELQDALSSLDGMMATWNGKGIRLGYPLPSSPENSNLDDETNVPDSANEAIYTNLAIRIASDIGKIVSQDMKIAAREAYRVIVSRTTQTRIKQFPSTTPTGAGNKPRRWGTGEYFPTPVDPLLAGDDGPIDFD
jgi:hypothetical protein